jgi:molybdopterin biosynthesis enzyme
MPGEPEIQRISRLMPLAEVIAAIEAAVAPVVVRPAVPCSSAGRVLAEDVVIAAPSPRAALALHDGFAVRSDDTADASAYAPATLPFAMPIDAGMALPQDADAVAAIDIIVRRGEQMQALAPVMSGEGVLAQGDDIAAGTPLLKAGSRISSVQAAVLTAADIDTLSVRIPRIRVLRARAADDAIIDAIITHVQLAAADAGCILQPASGSLADALSADGDDALVVVGGTGSGRNDAAVRALAGAGEVKAHGIALYPGQTAAFGIANGRPVLALPGRLDAALAVWHLLGRAILTRLSGCTETYPTRTATLTQKIASSVGISELIPARCDGPSATPIASGYVPLAALAQANGWILVAADSEGFPVGAQVMVRPWP